MWTCSLLKQNARHSLRTSYWSIFAACLITKLLSTLYAGAQGYVGRNTYWGYQGNSFSVNASLPWFLAFPITIFIIQPLCVGLCRLVMEHRIGNPPFETIFSTFSGPYLNVVKVTFLVLLQIALGFLLIIPGIYWAFTYCMVPYLLAENPFMPLKRAKELSRAMMRGEKWHTFLLLLSFLGWYLLGLLPFGLGVFFVDPYRKATFAELYAVLRAKAFAQGLTSNTELGGFICY